MSKNFPNLFTPVTIGKVKIRNRILSTGHDTMLPTDGTVNDALIAYHAARAGIAYVPQGVEMFIESVDNSACIHLYNSNPNRHKPRAFFFYFFLLLLF